MFILETKFDFSMEWSIFFNDTNIDGFHSDKVKIARFYEFLFTLS